MNSVRRLVLCIGIASVFAAPIAHAAVSPTSVLLPFLPGLATAPPAAGRADTLVYRNPFEILVTAPRIGIPLQRSSSATTVVGSEVLHAMPRGIAVDEALRMVPGVRIDNQADGERVHLSIRGQGILSERGIRGTKVLLDRMPLNDPTGFAPDLYDVDWATLSRVEVLRGPAAALYGGGSNAGVINLATENGTAAPLGASASFTAGSYGFWKGLGQIAGTSGNTDYRISYSRTMGDGYRVHTNYRGHNLYSKWNWKASPRVRLTPIVSYAEYFNQNAEGLNRAQMAEDPRMANPDAVPFNEYLKTARLSQGLNGWVQLAPGHEVNFLACYRQTQFTDRGNHSVQHRTYYTPSGTAQYTFHRAQNGWSNDLSAGSDLQWQTIDEHKNESLVGNREGAAQSNQSIRQRGLGAFVLDRIELGKEWSALLSLRYDRINNELLDYYDVDSLDLSGKKDFDRVTGRVGVSYSPSKQIGIYANWGQGFLPPATEELANNPANPGGFNESLKPATSQGEEVGAHGVLAGKLDYELAAFRLDTKDDFDRYRGVAPRDQETFYRNLGQSRRMGIETRAGWSPINRVRLQAAYTYSHFVYTKPDSLKDNFLPNSPEHQLSTDLECTVLRDLAVGFSTDVQSRWQVNPTNDASVNGITLWHARVEYGFDAGGLRAKATFAMRNLFDRKWVAFTEPDPDGNSYQPGAGREYYGGVTFGI